MLIGYARVSTQEQNLDLQLDALKKFGCKKIYADKISGSKIERPEFSNMFTHTREGDTIVVWRLDRLSRSLSDLITTITGFGNMNIGFISLSENIDTTTASGKLIFHIFASFAEFERNIIRERTKAGLEAARARGVLGGAKNKLNAKQIASINKLYDSKAHTVTEICKLFGISKPTLYKYLNTKQDSTS